MDYVYKKVKPVKLRDLGKDEKWLQERIDEDPSIIGLGDLRVIQREKTQPSGGRIDFILYDPEEEIKYETEVMLGKLNESHIIRTIEYWDVERKRYPGVEHRAVIVAEEITNRFFNVIGLLNRSVPIIAIQLNAFTIDDSLVLDFVKILDITEEEAEDEASNFEPVDRKYWENIASKDSLFIMDEMIKQISGARVKYNRFHVALGTSGTNFCWFHLRKGSHIHIHMKVGPENVDEAAKKFEEMGIGSGKHKEHILKIKITLKQFKESENQNFIKELLLLSEKYSH